MELLKLPLLFSSWLLILVFVLHCCSGCVEDERIALVEIKSSYVVREPIIPQSVILSWNQSSDCCRWRGVHCSPTAKHVTGLDLGFAYSTYGTNRRPLNFSLFLPFTELQRLSLRDNDIRFCIPTTDCFGSLAGLKKLKHLDLSYNYFHSKALSSFPASGSLKFLGLAGNNLTSEKFITASQALSKLSRIKYLDLSDNYFNTSIISSLVALSSLKTLILSNSEMKGRLPLEEFSKLNKLELLDLRMNKLYGDIPLIPNEWTSLKGLSIKYNQLNGTSLEGLCKIKNLEELDISFNSLNAEIPDCFRYLSSLNYFDVSHNQLEASFPSSIFENLTRLEFAAFSNNNFKGALSLSSFANNTELKLLDLSNNYQLEIETEDLVSPPSFQLEGIALTNCIVNKVSQSIPTFLSTQYMIQYIHLSGNNLKGNIPLWLFENKTNLTNLSLRDNSLSGPVILPSQSTKLVHFDVSNNKLSGEIPLSIGIFCPYLFYLNMSNNLLQGVIPSSVKNITGLEYLDLSNNNISGQFSNFVNDLPELYILDLSMNQFQGTLVTNNLSLPSLSYFGVNNNQLSGEIPTSLCNISMISFLDISENHFFGNLPTCIADLWVLHAAGNNLKGNLPTEICYMNGLESLDLSKNHFFGQFPSCFNMTHLEYLNLKDNELTGPFPNALSNLPLVTLDLGNNYFSGHIPSWIGTTLKLLKILSLKGNHFEGPISMKMCDLRFLRILDLSHNNLSGHIPSCLHNIGHNSRLNYQFSRTTTPQGLYSTELFPRDSMTNVFFSSSESSTLIISESIEFAIKRRTDSYIGGALHYLTGLDLSCNQLIGMIPENIGQMTWLRTLNLSNNLLIGSIPTTLSKLRDIESLDLSHNILVGRIPPQLAELHFLAAFSVAYNNLSGPTIGLVAQFSTFDESSYEGNPYLCGPPLVKSCTSMVPSPEGQVTNDIHEDKKATMDRLILFASIAAGLIVGFWGWMALLFLNRNLRYSFFLAVDGYMEQAFDMVGNLLPKMKSCL